MSINMALEKDGTHWWATGPRFVDLATSESGFGLTKEEAVADLNRRLGTSFTVRQFAVVCEKLHRAMTY